MAAITLSELEVLRGQVMTGHGGVSVILAIPTATSDATAGVFLVKDPKGGTAPNTVATEPGNAKGGSGIDGMSWKKFSAANLRTAYGL
jgi:hypothetical protein